MRNNERIIYQIYPLTFNDGNNDGVGDLKGITQKLKYLSEIGINSIWLSPITKSPLMDNGYDVSDYYEINPLFGDMKDFEELVAKAKNFGIEIIMDIVMNHTSSDTSDLSNHVKT